MAGFDDLRAKLDQWTQPAQNYFKQGFDNMRYDYVQNPLFRAGEWIRQEKPDQSLARYRALFDVMNDKGNAEGGALSRRIQELQQQQNVRR